MSDKKYYFSKIKPGTPTQFNTEELTQYFLQFYYKQRGPFLSLTEVIRMFRFIDFSYPSVLSFIRGKHSPTCWEYLVVRLDRRVYLSIGTGGGKPIVRYSFNDWNNKHFPFKRSKGLVKLFILKMTQGRCLRYRFLDWLEILSTCIRSNEVHYLCSMVTPDDYLEIEYHQWGTVDRYKLHLYCDYERPDDVIMNTQLFSLITVNFDMTTAMKQQKKIRHKTFRRKIECPQCLQPIGAREPNDIEYGRVDFVAIACKGEAKVLIQADISHQCLVCRCLTVLFRFYARKCPMRNKSKISRDINSLTYNFWWYVLANKEIIFHDPSFDVEAEDEEYPYDEFY
jgi:hypothetical protein